MDSLISTFHLDAKLLIAQIVNFAVVFLVLYFLVFRPLFKVTTDRSKTIEKSLAEAKEIEERLEKTKAEQKEMIKQAKIEASVVLEEASRQAEEKKLGLVSKAKEEIGDLINREKAKMQADKAETLRMIRAEVADLIKLSLEKILQEKSDKVSDEKIINKALKHME
ncbi:MAG TPA: F0F1 ATP synthase subunit B [bacterium]|jgi:F-type H+-transporting ATPase subunit b|nr:F0F1 ATP synthase subunit B [bacterium]